MKIDFAALHQVRRQKSAIGITLFINWAVKPFSMALLGWIFIRHAFRPYPSCSADQQLHRRPDPAWRSAVHCDGLRMEQSLRRRCRHFTLTQVALNDLVMVFAFAPIVALLLGVSAIPCLGKRCSCRW
jgi:ACR3 family arsenite transporter